MQHRFPLSCLCGMLGLLLPGAAFPQVSLTTDPSPRFEWRGHLETDFRNQFKTKTDGGDRFESWRMGIGGDIGGPINESILVGVQAGYRYANYEFHLDNPPGVPSVFGSSELPYDPWGSINTFDIAPNTTILVGDRFSIVATVPIRYSGETGARENGFSAGISGLVRWQVTDKLRIGAGIGVTSQLEDDAETFPIISFDWQISETINFRTEGSWIQGGDAILIWGPNETFRLTLSAGYERNRFRLDDNGPRIDRDGIGEITAVPLEVGLRFRLYERAFFDFRFGMAVAGQIRVENSNGNTLFEEDYDPAPRLGLSLSVPFRLP